MKRVFKIFVFMAFTSLIIASGGGEVAVTVGVPDFSPAKYKNIIVLPFMSVGDNSNSDDALARQFADNLKQMGFAVFDVTLISDFLTENDIDIKKAVTTANLAKLRKKFNFSAVAKGIVYYKYKGAATNASDPMDFLTTKTSGLMMSSEEIRFYSNTGVPLIALNCPKLYMADATDEISEALENVIKGRAQDLTPGPAPTAGK